MADSTTAQSDEELRIWAIEQAIKINPGYTMASQIVTSAQQIVNYVRPPAVVPQGGDATAS